MADNFEDFRLKVFMTVSELGSFTLAAQRLGVSQPAVSQNVTALEKSLGVQLLERRRGDIFLTEAGKAFRDYASHIIYWYDAAEKMFGEAGRATVGRPVVIAADAVSAGFVLPGALSILHASRPDIGFIINPYGTEGADVEITVDPSPETMDFEGESRLVGVLDAAVVCSPENRSVASAAAPGEGRALPFSTIAGIHVSNQLVIWDRYESLMTPDILSRVAVKSSSEQLIKSLVRESGNLVGILPYLAVKKELSEGTLVRLPVTLPDFSFDIHLNPALEFGGREACLLLRSALENSLQ